MKSSRKKGTSSAGTGWFWRSLMFGNLFGLSAVLLLLLAAAWMVTKFQIPVTALSEISFACVLIGSFLSGVLSGILSRRKGLLIGLTSGGVWLLLLICGNLILYDMRLTLMGMCKLGLGFLLGTFGGALGAAIMRKKEKKRYTY